MEPLGGCGQGQEARRVQEPEHVHIKEEPETWEGQYEDLVKQEAWCVDEVGTEPSSPETAGWRGVSSAAMLAGLYADHTVKDELVLGPELLHRPTVTPVFCGWPLADIDRGREQLQKWSARLARVLRREGTPSPSPSPSPAPSARSHTEQDALSTRGHTERAGARRSAKDGAVGLGAESAVSWRARRQLAAACAVRLERLRAPPPPPPPPAPVRPPSARHTYACDMCTQRFNSKSVLIRHIGSHYRCEVCEETFMMSDCLSRHERNCTKNKQNERELANKITISKSHGEVILYYCDECGKRFKRKIFLSKHIQQSHTLRQVLIDSHSRSFKRQVCLTRKKPFHCSQCVFRGRTKTCLQWHQMVHTGEKPFKCDFCDFKCNRKSNLRTHQRAHTGEKPFKCGICDFKCSRKSTLQRHQMIHTGEKLFKCDICDTKCSRKSTLQRHQMIHTGEKPFKCGYCDFKCSQQSTLQRHRRIHTREKPFKCGYCDFKCSDKSNLRRHEMLHRRAAV